MNDTTPLLRADRDLAFLARDDMRAVRLLLEYLKPELTLRDRGLNATLVVFGSTQIAEPAEAQRELDMARARLGDRDDSASRREIRILERRRANARYYEMARAFGELAGRHEEMVVMTGGGPGLMEAANRGAAQAGAPTIGLNITLPSEQAPNSYLTPELSFEFRYFALRKLHFMLRARALVAFPGGFGTLDELFDVLTLVQTGRSKELPIVLVGRSFWERLIDFDFLVDEGLIRAADRQLLTYAETPEEIWEAIQGWSSRAIGGGAER
ncbi:MAG: TIGR00730 family Rossman fold protein [bacterium]|nr:TIGR00730 family Rossman fold protein [bacterium]MCP5069592.1 TIGR00730 family Rossman fold protein [bacterium]